MYDIQRVFIANLSTGASFGELALLENKVLIEILI